MMTHLKKMYRNRSPVLLVIPLGIVVMISLAVLFIGSSGLAINTSTGLGSGAQCAFNYSLTAIDSEGNRVQIPVTDALSAFLIGGVPAESIDVGIAWTVTGTGIQWNTLNLHGKVEINIVSGFREKDVAGQIIYTPIWTLVDELSFDNSTLIGEWVDNLVLGTDICSDSGAKIDGTKISKTGSGWFYMFKAWATASALDDLGDPISDTALLGTFALWITFDPTLTVSGSVIQ